VAGVSCRALAEGNQPADRPRDTHVHTTCHVHHTHTHTTTTHTTPRAPDGAYLEGFREGLSRAAAAGERPRPSPGAGADASGQGHLWRDFGSLKTKQRLALLAEMQNVSVAAWLVAGAGLLCFWLLLGGCVGGGEGFCGAAFAGRCVCGASVCAAL
jgi:hypothetical protein